MKIFVKVAVAVVQLCNDVTVTGSLGVVWSVPGSLGVVWSVMMSV